MSPRARLVRFGASVAAVLAGIICGALIPGTPGGLTATVLIGMGLVALVSLLFYEVGLTEDRDRARAPDPRSRSARPSDPSGAGKPHTIGRSPGRLGRNRSHRRDLP